MTIGDKAIVGGQAGVTKSVPDGVFVSGYPAMPHHEARRAHAHLMRIPSLKKRMDELEARLENGAERPTSSNGESNS